MRVKIENLGPICEADLELNGITVIGAVNGSGKSTIGRVLYSTLKNLNFYDEQVENLLDISYRNHLRTIIERIENNIMVDLFDLWEGDEINFDEFDINQNILNNKDLEKDDRRQIIINLKKSSENFVEEQLAKAEKNEDNLDNTDFFKQTNQIIEKYRHEISETDILIIKEKLNSIKEVKAIPYTNLIRLVMKKEFDREFGTNLINYKCGIKKDKAKINIIENNNTVFEAVIYSNKLTGMTLAGLKNTETKDVTYIDNPFVVDDYNRIIKNTNNKNHIKSRTIDLLEKMFLEDRKQDELSDKCNIQLSDQITEILKGAVDFSDNVSIKKHVFKENGAEIQLNNIATGFKSFVILDFLYKNNIFQPNHLLIIDEPEIHLHPKWQVEYAKILIELVKNYEIKILINTHSTYFVEALKVLSEKKNLEDITRFYKIETSDEGSHLMDVTDNIGLIYDDLNFAFEMIDDIITNKSKEGLGDE